MVVDALLQRLEGVERHNGYWMARCPVHEDSTPSLSVRELDGEIFLKCFAHCPTKEIWKALRVEESDLRSRVKSPSGPPSAVYEYHDRNGRLLFQTLRYDEPRKTFKQRHLDPDSGEWVYSMADVERVLYRLPELVAAIAAGRWVYVVEGEKDVETMRAHGHTATTNPMGAGKWREEYAGVFVGANVVVVADRDEPGRNHANHVVRTLRGKAADVRLVQAKVGKDASDHFDAGFAVKELVPRKQRARKGIFTAAELANAGIEELNASASDLPGYAFSPALPLTFRPGRVYAVAAYTGDGKTRFGLQGFRTLASAGINIGYFSLEMSERDLRNVLLAHDGVPLRLTENPWELRADLHMRELYEQALAKIGSWSAEIVVEAAMNAAKITEYTRDREYDVVVVDHLHRFGHDERTDLEHQVRELTNLALDSNVCVILLCQLRRAPASKAEQFPEPTLSHLRETGVIEQEASMVLSLWRQRADNVVFSTQPRIRVLKNRHTTGVADAAGKFWTVGFDVERQLFRQRSSSFSVDDVLNAA